MLDNTYFTLYTMVDLSTKRLLICLKVTLMLSKNVFII